MEYEQITTDLGDNVLTITLNRPERLNAFTTTMGDELRAAFDDADADDDVRAVIVTGAGRGFCAGADIREFAGKPRTMAEKAERMGLGTALFEAVYDVRVPVIAAMHGFSIGAGLALAALCDLRIATDDCVMSMPETSPAKNGRETGSTARMDKVMVQLLDGAGIIPCRSPRCALPHLRR